MIFFSLINISLSINTLACYEINQKQQRQHKQNCSNDTCHDDLSHREASDVCLVFAFASYSNKTPQNRAHCMQRA